MGASEYMSLTTSGVNDSRLADPRGIDVAVLSRYKIDSIVTHQDVEDAPNHDVFSRDCLEVRVKAQGKHLTLFVNHLKSMMGGRAQTRARREAQCAAIVDIVKERFGDDLNDLFQSVPVGWARHYFRMIRK